jgi:hypothetical protein
LTLGTPPGEEVLRITRPDEVGELTNWVHDAFLEDAIQFSAESGRVVVPFMQESAWGDLHPAMPDPELAKETFFARHYHVPLTRCFIVVEQAISVDTDIEWGCPDLLDAKYSQSVFRVMSGDDCAAVSVHVAELDVRVLLSSEVAQWMHRKVLRGLRIESDRPVRRGRA